MSTQRVLAALLSAVALAGLAALPGRAAARAVTQTLVFDAVVDASFVDTPPIGPSPGDTELSTGRLRDAAGRFVGTVHDRCVFRKLIPHDVLERCSGSAETREGTATVAGVGHLYSMNPPWQIVGRSGAYKGLHGTQIFATDIALDPNVPLAAGRAFSVSVIRLTSARRLHIGVVARPTANASFIRHANTACRTAEAKARRLPSFPFSPFDPFHPDPKLLPQVGRFFDQPARRRLPGDLIRKLKNLGRPPTDGRAWDGVLTSRRTLLSNEARQTKAALGDDAAGFVRTVYQMARDYNWLVFRSAVFGVQSCTFG